MATITPEPASTGVSIVTVIPSLLVVSSPLNRLLSPLQDIAQGAICYRIALIALTSRFLIVSGIGT